MIALTPGPSSRVIVAEAHGKVRADDYEKVLTPAVDAAAVGGAKVRLLYVLGADFDGFEPGAALDDAKLGMHHWKDFERIGLVTDHEAYRVMVKVLGALVPGEVRLFSLAERERAEEWVSEE